MLRELFDDWDNDAIWSKLSQHFIANEHRKTDLAYAKKKKERKKKRLSTCLPGCLVLCPLPFKAVQSCSRQSELHRVYIFVTGGTFVNMSPPAEQPFHAPA